MELSDYYIGYVLSLLNLLPSTATILRCTTLLRANVRQAQMLYHATLVKVKLMSFEPPHDLDTFQNVQGPSLAHATPFH